MKKILLFIVFGFSIVVMQAQITVDFSQTIVETAYVFDPANPDIDVEAQVDLSNLSNKQRLYHWVREELLLPAGWGSAVCDRACYFQTVSEQDLMLEPNETLKFLMHAYSNTNPGDSAVVKITIFEVGNEANFDEVTFIFGSFFSANEEVESANGLMLFPNPTSDYFSISEGDEVARIELYSIIGSKVKSFDTRGQSYFDISELHRGIYLARLSSKSGKILKTVRLNKK